MFIHEKTYELEELMRLNLHIHTFFSRCAKPEMILRDIISEAERACLQTIAITDHIHPGEDGIIAGRTALLREQLSELETPVKVLFGSELSLYGIDLYSLRDSDADLDYKLYSHNHYHLDCWQQPAERTPEGYKKHCYESLKCFLPKKKADCMAHPFADGYIVRRIEGNGRGEIGSVTRLWTDNELGEILSLGNENAVAWELNVGELCDDPVFARRYFNLGREIGVMFNFGTDAHRLCYIDPEQYVRMLKKILL